MFSLVSGKFLAMRNITLYSVHTHSKVDAVKVKLDPKDTLPFNYTFVRLLNNQITKNNINGTEYLLSLCTYVLYDFNPCNTFLLFQFNVLQQSSHVQIQENVFHLFIDVMVTVTAGTIQMKMNVTLQHPLQLPLQLPL